MSDIENLVPADERGDEATANESPDTAPGADHCIWPGCTRPRAPGRVTGSGRQKEYCLQADPPERGGSPVHNARNRWAALRAGAGRPVTPGEPSGGNAGGDGGPAGAAGPGAGQGNAGGGQPATSGRDPGPFTSAKKRAGELLEQARRQHAAALDGLRAECELYQRAGEELAALSDPAALDLEIATIAARAGRQVAQAEQDAADAHRAQLAAQRERDEAVRLRAAADEAAEQLTEDTAEAERVLAERTAGFERDLADLASRAQAAEAAQRAARDEAAAVKAAAEAEVTAARDAAESARARAEETAAEARAAAAAARDQARREVAAAQERADGLIAAARLEADKAVAGVREQAARERALVEQRALAADAGADRARAERDRAQAAAASAAAAGAAAEARATAVTGELERAREEAGRLRDVHAGELARLESAHEALLGAERARAARAEADLDALRAATA
ncbi:MAG TPA: hypothetical protein VGG83_13415 [Trebonia sp.]